MSRDEILNKIWGIDANPTNRTIDNFVVKLRKKIEKQPDKPKHILTVYGYGYKLVPNRVFWSVWGERAAQKVAGEGFFGAGYVA